MSLRWLILLIALLSAALGSLTTIRATTLFTWKLAVAAGEFGHIIAAIPLLAAALALVRLSRDGVFSWISLGLCLLAVGFLLKPVAQARKVARDLPARLEAAFGPAAIDRAPFRIATLFQWAGTTASFETRTFTPKGSAQDLALDFYRARSPAPSAAPCVIVIHGGGWDRGDRTQLVSFNRWLAGGGHAVAAISYRLAPDHLWPAQRDDALAALAYLKSHATELGIDATRFILFGRSAGGQIASAAAFAANDPAIRGVVAFYAPHDMRFAWDHSREDDVLDTFKLLRQLLGGSPEEAARSYESASALMHVERGVTPPTLLVHGTIDTLVWRRQSERLAARLDEELVPNVFVELPWATHGFDVNLHGPGGQLSTFALEWFIAAVTR